MAEELNNTTESNRVDLAHGTGEHKDVRPDIKMSEQKCDES